MLIQAPLLRVEQHLEQPNVYQTQTSSSGDQLPVIEQLSAEDIDFSPPLEESMLEQEQEQEQEQEFVIPDIGLSEELVQSKQLSADQEDARIEADIDEGDRSWRAPLCEW